MKIVESAANNFGSSDGYAACATPALRPTKVSAGDLFPPHRRRPASRSDRAALLKKSERKSACYPGHHERRSHEDHDQRLLDVGALYLARDLCLVAATPTAVTTTARCCRQRTAKNASGSGSAAAGQG